MPPYYQREGLRFECTGCGRCCVDESEGMVRVSREEAEALRQHLGLSTRWFRRRYLEPVEDGWRGLRLNPDGRCPFLGEEGRCRVYEARPLQCRLYPFWPELVMTRQGWRGEAERCEGIDRGDQVPRDHIERCLSRDRIYRVIQLREATLRR